MQCRRCKNMATYEGLCGRCYSMILEKRVRKDMRLNRIVKPRMRVKCKDKLSKILIDRIMKAPISIVSTGADIVLEKWTKDDGIHSDLKRLFAGEKLIEAKVSILKTLTDKEAINLAEIFGLEWSPRKKDDDISEFIDKVSSSYKETRYSLSNAMDEVRKILH